MASKFDWKSFLISVLGTAIGVGLTFFVNGINESRKKDKAQRLTAIMVIHDIDNTIDLIKTLKSAEEESGKMLQAIQKRQDNLDAVPYDTLNQVLNLLVRRETDFRFDTSKEMIFNSDLDTWENLGSTKFIDNVQSFYFDRQYLQDLFNNSDEFSEPIPNFEYMKLIQGMGLVSMEEYENGIRPFLREKLKDKRVNYFIIVSNYRIQTLNLYIDSWTNLNEENKFLMGITDKELEEYVNSITNNGKPLRKDKLVGLWEYAKEDDNSFEFDFHQDNSFDHVINYSTFSRTLNWTGRLKYSISCRGTWTLQADSLILNMDYSDVDVKMDLSGIEPEENKQDSLDAWAKSYREKAIKYYTELPSEETRVSYKARLDSSHDKMELTSKKGARYLKRKL